MTNVVQIFKTISVKQYEEFHHTKLLKLVHVLKKTKVERKKFLNKGELTIEHYMLHNSSIITNVCTNFQKKSSKTEGGMLKREIT